MNAKGTVAENLEAVMDRLNRRPHIEVLPTPTQELNRKVNGTFEWLISGVEQGRITEEQCSIAADAVFMAVSGLVDDHIMEIMRQVEQECVFVKTSIRRHFAKDGQTVTINWDVGSEQVTLSKRQDGLAYGGSLKECANSAEAKQFMVKAADALILKGYIEL